MPITSEELVAIYSRRLAMINAIVGDGDEEISGLRLKLIKLACYEGNDIGHPVQKESAEYLTADDDADLDKIEKALMIFRSRRRRAASVKG